MSRTDHDPSAGLERELAETRRRLAEAEETLEAIRSGAVDAFLIQEEGTNRVYTLQTAERPYRVLVETMQQGALVLGPDGTVLYGNGRVAELLGVPHEKFAGSPLSQSVGQDSRAALAAMLTKARREGSASGEAELVTSAGASVCVHLTVARMPGNDDTSLSIIVTDLTREKEHQALEREQDLMRQRDELMRDADRRKDEFLAMLAHELRMPLAPVRSALEVLRLKGGTGPDTEWAQNVIERQVKRMTRLVDDLLDLGRIAQDQMTVRREPVDLSEVLRGALETVGPLIEEAGHELAVVMPRTKLVVNGDAGRLTQVFANLLTNACNFTDRFGSIDVRGAIENGVAVVRITDDGVGISRELMPHIFDRFRLTDRSLGHERSGLGVGLALVRKIVDLHGGSVTLESPGEGRGCTATVRLPLHADDEPLRPEVEAPGAREGAGRRILIVDDNVDTADALAALLRLYGDAVRTAYDGAMALDVGRSFEPQVVLLDIAMPGMDGHEVCRRLRAEEWGEGAHVIAVTGLGQASDRARALKSGFDHHLLKPVDPATLRTMLDGLSARRPTPWPELKSPR